MPSALIFTPEPLDLPILDEDPRFFVPAYYGPYGARAINLDVTDVDWNEIAELVDASYRMVAPKRLVVYARAGAATGLPGVEVDEANGHTGFSVRGKRFAWLLVDHHEDGRLALCVKAPPGEQETLVGQGVGYFVPAYLGSRGWVGIDVAPDAAADWDEVSLLVEQAWRMCAPKRLVAELNDASPRTAPREG